MRYMLTEEYAEPHYLYQFTNDEQFDEYMSHVPCDHWEVDSRTARILMDLNQTEEVYGTSKVTCMTLND